MLSLLLLFMLLSDFLFSLSVGIFRLCFLVMLMLLTFEFSLLLLLMLFLFCFLPVINS